MLFEKSQSIRSISVGLSAPISLLQPAIRIACTVYSAGYQRTPAPSGTVVRESIFDQHWSDCQCPCGLDTSGTNW